MTSLSLPDDYDDMTIRKEKERYVYLRRFESRWVRKGVLVRSMYRHTVIGVPKPFPLSNINNDGTSMTGVADGRFGPSLPTIRRSS
jgi:hypothetical protein